MSYVDRVRCLVVAKAPVPGRSKTRLGVAVGHEAAAELAAAALLDTVRVCREAFGAARCSLAIEGDVGTAVRGAIVAHEVSGWTVFPQRGHDFGARLAYAHADCGGPTIQIGMDTPQATAEALLLIAAGLDDQDAVLGPAEDGGWWALALRDSADAACLVGVPMSTDRTAGDTAAALRAAGLRVGLGTALRDVDTIADAERVAAAAPGSEFARAWARLGRVPS